MTLRNIERDSLVKYRIQRARESLLEAKDNANLGHWNLVANRLYYASFYAQTALLISRGLSSLTHSGVRSLINQYFVKTGIISIAEKSLLQRLFSMRQTGDYEDNYDWSQEELEPVIPEAENVVEKIITLIDDSK